MQRKWWKGTHSERWKGTCDAGEKFSAINCNQKLTADYIDERYGGVPISEGHRWPWYPHGAHCRRTEESQRTFLVFRAWSTWI
ncbi:hypothetical protein FH972_004155 [Carpinus fangiana]|uniref:Uncharacterized protein n=1 Tax=Carpinus fangiana TaxID=176857 RepID=A0A5N6QMZ2_9ROSI|nr:hypothetical protein FH972_004155 [Carpinus fangiana]